jgi:hypothetical protein
MEVIRVMGLREAGRRPSAIVEASGRSVMVVEETCCETAGLAVAAWIQ